MGMYHENHVLDIYYISEGDDYLFGQIEPNSCVHHRGKEGMLNGSPGVTSGMPPLHLYM